MKITVTSFKRSHACTATLSAPNPASGHHRPTPPLKTPRHSQASLGQSCGVTAPFSWVLVHIRFCLCPLRVYFQSFVSSGSSMVGLMATSSKRAYAIPKAAARRAPATVYYRGLPDLTSPTDLKITAFLSPPNKLLKKKYHRASVFTRVTAGSICHRSLSLNQYFLSPCSQAEFLPRVNFRSSGHSGGLRGPGGRAISLLMIFWWG